MHRPKGNNKPHQPSLTGDEIQKRGAIIQASTASLVALQAELSKHEAKFQRLKETGIKAPKTIKKPTVWQRPNTGIQARVQKDLFQHEQDIQGNDLDPDLKERKRIQKMKAKAKIYEQMERKNGLHYGGGSKSESDNNDDDDDDDDDEEEYELGILARRNLSRQENILVEFDHPRRQQRQSSSSPSRDRKRSRRNSDSKSQRESNSDIESDPHPDYTKCQQQQQQRHRQEQHRESSSHNRSDWDRDESVQEAKDPSLFSNKSNNSNKVKDNDDPWVEYVDEFGRTRSARKSQVPSPPPRSPSPPRQLGIRNPENPFPVYQPPGYTPPKPTATSSAYSTGTGPVMPTHYDNTTERRARGVGFYAFSKDETERQQQMQDLKDRRAVTELERSERGENGDGSVTTKGLNTLAAEKRKLVLEKRKELIRKQKEKSLASTVQN